MVGLLGFAVAQPYGTLLLWANSTGSQLIMASAYWLEGSADFKPEMGEQKYFQVGKQSQDLLVAKNQGSRIARGSLPV